VSMHQLFQNLIVVAGHAAFKDSVIEPPEDPEREDYWVLKAFQSGEQPYYIEHIKCGVDLLRHDPKSLLLFSGGRTRLEAGHWSEAETYRQIASTYNYWCADAADTKALKERVETEEFARDSFENLQYSLYRFHQLTGNYPAHVTVAGWKFKQDRFDFHRQTLGIPADRFSYVGCNNPSDLPGALAGEETALKQFRADPSGEHPPLSDKKHQRNPFDLTNPYINLPPIKLT
jgi:hypothetical protein